MSVSNLWFFVDFSREVAGCLDLEAIHAAHLRSGHVGAALGFTPQVIPGRLPKQTAGTALGQPSYLGWLEVILRSAANVVNCRAMTYQFHLTVHARPEQKLDSQTLDVGGKEIVAIQTSTVELQRLLPVAFETAMARLEQLPCMFIELDGSFVWAIHEPDRRWQVDGHLFDRDDRLVYVELHGSCPWEKFQDLTACMGRSQTEVVYQLVREGVIVDETELRRLWGEGDSVGK